VVLVALASTTRVAYWFATLHYAPTSDAFSYQVIADNIARGNGVADVFPQVTAHATAFRPPGFPAVLAAAYRMFGTSVGLGRAVNLVIGVLVVLLIERLVSRTAGSTAGLVAAGLVAVYPPLVANDVTLLAESLSLLLLLLIVIAVIDDRWQLAALATGVLVLTRNSAQLFVLVIAALLLRRVGWRRTLGFAGISALVVVPWIVRNQIQLGRPVLTTSNGFNLTAAYSQEAHDSQGFVDAAFDPRFESTRLLQFDEAAWDRALITRGLDGLRAHPGDVVAVSRRNALGYFELQPSANTSAERIDGRNLDIRKFSLPAYYLVTTMGIVGLWHARHQRVAVLMAAIAAYFTLVSLVSVAAPRLRAPFDLACCIGVGFLAGQLVGSTGAGPLRSRADSSA